MQSTDQPNPTGQQPQQSQEDHQQTLTETQTTEQQPQQPQPQPQQTTNMTAKQTDEQNNGQQNQLSADQQLCKLYTICLKLNDNIQMTNGHFNEPDTSQATESILQLLVTEDMSNITSATLLRALFIDHLTLLPPKIISEVLSVLIAIVKKSVFHLESARTLLIPCLNYLVSHTSNSNNKPKLTNNNNNDNNNSNNNHHSNNNNTESLTKHFIREWLNLLVAHSCDVEELRSIIKHSEHDPTLLAFIQQANLKQRNRPSAFFAFPGTKGSMMSLPPFQKWPIQLGWSFSTWFFLEPKACAQPYLYNFKTGKSGLGYSAHFTGNCLVLTSIRVKGKGIQHCVAYEFPSYKWIHCAITYHNKWRSSDIKVYINGQLSANIEMPWQVQTNEIYDKCFIGGSGSMTLNDRFGELNSFCGQMAAIYLFNEGLSAAQICAIHRLGPYYTGQFKYSHGSHMNLPPQVCKVLYEDKLASTLFCLFTPVAVDSGTLCIQLAPFRSSTSVSAQNYFISAPHAALLGETKAIITQSICSTLQSLGCSRSLLPLLEVYASKGNAEACASLIGFLCDLLESSPHWFTNEIVQNNGFVIVACALAQNARLLISETLLDIFLNLARTLLTSSSTLGDSLLLKHLMDNILFNPTLWINSDTKLQIKLYNYLATEFLHGTHHAGNKYTISNSSHYGPGQGTNAAVSVQNQAISSVSSSNLSTEQQLKSALPNEPPAVSELLFGEIRRVSTVLQSLHALKHFYYLVEEKGANIRARNHKFRPSQKELTIIRSHILLFTKELIVRATTVPLDETQGLLNYLSSCSHEENLLDVLQVLASLLKNHPLTMVQALDQKNSVKVIFTLIGSKSEKVRIASLRLLALLLSQCTLKKKQDIMGPNNLFTLICDKLRPYKPLTLDTYEALMGLVVESNEFSRSNESTSSLELSKFRIENSLVVKVIANLLFEERPHQTMKVLKENESSEPDIRKMFINDLWNLIVNSRENRRIILQMSVWQHWLINLIHSTIDDSQLIRDQVLAIFRVLLYHAIRYEYGGWRVWIDTLAIIHTKVSYDEFYQQMNADHNSSNLISSNQHDEAPKVTVLKDPTKRENSSFIPVVANKVEEEEEGDVKAKEQECSKELNQPPPTLSSISERIPEMNNGIQMEERSDDDEVGSSDNIHQDSTQEDAEKVSTTESSNLDSGLTKSDCPIDSVDVAPSRAFRKLSLKSDNDKNTDGNELNRQPSLTSITLEDPSNENIIINHDYKFSPNGPETIMSEPKHEEDQCGVEASAPAPAQPVQQANVQKATASPAFRIPEFKWSSILIKLLNDLMFSIECDLYQWRCLAKCTNLDSPPFIPKSIGASGQSSSSQAASSASRSNTNSNLVAQIELVLQRPENQIYIVNVVHLVSQLADNIIIASGGLLPLLADATGGAGNASRSSSAAASANSSGSKLSTCEGLTMPQANALLYRLINMVDLVIFAASHVNLAELEADKNTTSGGILRQCLRLACTVTVKNCLILRGVASGSINESSGIATDVYSTNLNDFPKDMFDSYQGCSLLSANGLFDNSALSLENSDLIANVEYSPNQTPNTSAMPSLLPFQPMPIKDPNKLLQYIDIKRIQACIYHEQSIESRQAQFLALSSLYFISVLMVSKYRDIIEPKQHRDQSTVGKQTESTATTSTEKVFKDRSIGAAEAQSSGSSVSNIEANLLSFGRINPSPSVAGASSSGSNALTDMLTSKLETTLDTVCPLLKLIMCDYCSFLSRTLIGSHGQDLVNKETDRTFKRANTSPVELVMLLCSQEWQNTLQKNAGLAFIELINEGRVLSHGMKDHIVRVAMEAEFIMSRLRADDVAKHEHFSVSCAETLSARLHEEVLINSLISSASRRDYMIYYKFREAIQRQKKRNYKLDIWEDDDRRKRRFVIDSWDDTYQNIYTAGHSSSAHEALGEANTNTNTLNIEGSKEAHELAADKADTKRILDLQKTIELGGGIDGHCSVSGSAVTAHLEHANGSIGLHPAATGTADDDECEDDDFECEDEMAHNDSNSPESDNDLSHKIHGRSIHTGDAHHLEEEEDDHYLEDVDLEPGAERPSKHANAGPFLSNTNKSASHGASSGLVDPRDHLGVDSKGTNTNNQIWDYDECGSVNEFAGSVVFAAECSLIWNIYAIPGVIQLTNHELYFEPNQNINEAIDVLKREAAQLFSHQAQQDDNTDTNLVSIKAANPDGSPTIQADEDGHVQLRKLDLKVLRYCDFLTCNGKVLLNDIRAIFSRHYLLQPNALEIFLAHRTSVMFAFNDFDTVKRAVRYLPPVGVGIKYGISQSRRASLMTPRQLFAASNMTQKWQRREIGNFQYLMFLNTIAGRTYQDLNQYPVFPWILTNYESEELDLNLPSNFRDLSKPVGALNNKRRLEFIERYQSWDNPKVPAFHYGTHYSTAAFTSNWLCRLRGSHNNAYLALQDGKYEEETRLFLSIGDSWVSSLTGGQQNVKELIPEFFYLPEMFHTNLGLPEVEFPPWAKSAEHFVRLHRLALESELVSCQLHQWIDLIFGYKQRGPEAINSVNTFYYLTYQGNVNLNMIQDQSLREAIESQIKHFGQTPSQLTTEPHPPRFSALHVSPMVFSSPVDEVNKVVKFSFNTSVLHISSCISNYIAPSSSSLSEGSSTGTAPNSNNSSTPSSILTITSNNQYQIHKWMPGDQSGHPLTIDPQLEHPGAARRHLIDIDDQCSGITFKVKHHHQSAGSSAVQDTLEEVQWPCAHYIVTLNGRYIIMGSFYDNSFRVFSTETGKLSQVIYGHRAPITCMARSDGNAVADFYLATGSQDCSLLLWTWNERYAQVEGSGVSTVHNPLPKLTISGHQTVVLSVVICAELGLIISGSKNLILVHTTTSGENLLELDVLLPNLLDKSPLVQAGVCSDREAGRCSNKAATSEGHSIQRPHVEDRQKTILEASMLGEGGSSLSATKDGLSKKGALASQDNHSQDLSSANEKFQHLRELCKSDYYINNLQVARELALIICVALPPPRRRGKAVNETGERSNSASAALLITFDLKGSLIDSTTIGHAVNGPRLGDCCVLETTRDGEHLIINDSPTSIKIYRTFDLQTVYAYNTNDLPNTISEEQNRVKSLALLDHRYILAGLENGKIIVYNVDFKNFQ